jgi:hypothetical protein
LGRICYRLSAKRRNPRPSKHAQKKVDEWDVPFPHPDVYVFSKSESTPHSMSNFDQRYEQYRTASKTNPLLNNTMTNFITSACDTPAYDTPACETNKRGVSPITSPHTPTIVWGAMSLLAVIVFTIMGEWIPAIFFVILGVWKINSGLKSAKRRKPEYRPRF